MSDALNGAAAREETERQRLVDMARVVAAGALSQTTVRASQAALAAVQGRDGGSALAEPARDLRQLRAAPAVRTALAADLDLAQAVASRLLADALWVGFAQAAKDRATGLPLTVELTDADRAELVDYPIYGYTTDEIAADLRYQLGRDVERVLAAPLTGTIDPQGIPPALGDASYRHADRVARAVGEAHAVGVGAAVRAIGAALTGAA